MDGSQGSLQAALNTLEIFGSISGLKINKDNSLDREKKEFRQYFIHKPPITMGEY